MVKICVRAFVAVAPVEASGAILVKVSGTVVGATGVDVDMNVDDSATGTLQPISKMHIRLTASFSLNNFLFFMVYFLLFES